MEFDIRERIIHHAIELRDKSKQSGKIIAEMKGDKKALEEYFKKDAEESTNFMNRFFALLDEYEAINGKVKADL